MHGVLAELRKDYDTQLLVEYIDIKKYPKDAQSYGITKVPVWIFLASKGDELHRHQGVFDAKSIVQQWKKLDYLFHEDF